MRVSQLLVLTVAVLISVPALACRTPHGPPIRASREDRLEQRHVISDLAERSNEIVLVRALNGPSEFPATNTELGGQFPGAFQTIEVLKGTVGETLTAEVRWGIVVVSCGGGDFSELVVERGEEYILYVHEGKVLRAGARERPPGHVTFRQELRQLRRLRRPNNSSKPTPLRGAA